MKSFLSAASLMAVIANQARSTYIEGAGANGTAGQFARFSTAVTANILNGTDLVWALEA